MKKWLFLLCTVACLWACGGDDGKKSTNVCIIVINNMSYNVEEEAYNKLEAYLDYLKTYYSNEDNSEEIIEHLEQLLGEGMNDLLKDDEDVISVSDIEIVIDDIKKQENDIIPNVPTLDEVGKAPLTILAYLVANNNLDDDLLANIGTMYDGLATMDKAATLLVYWDGKTTIGANKSSHLILKYETDGKGNINEKPALDEEAPLDDVLEVGKVMKEYSAQLSTDKQVMAKVLKDMVGMTSSGRIGLVTGSHASSWLNSIYLSRSRAFGQDGSGTDNTMLISDMVEAMKSVGKRFDFVLFDACFMGTAEVAYAFRDVADYQISSVMEVPAYGFPYDVFMDDLYKGTVEGYKEVCQAYIDFYSQRYKAGNQAWATIALMKSSEIQGLINQVKAEIVEHKEAVADYDVKKLQEYGRSGGPDIAYDLEQFMKDLNGDVVPAAFKAQLDKAVLHKGCLETARPSSYKVDAANYCGLGIYIPIASRSKWNDYFKTIDWYEVSGWSDVTFSWDF